MDDQLRETGAGVEQAIGPWRVHMLWDDTTSPGGPTRVLVEPSEDARPEDLAGGISQTVLRRIAFKAANSKRNAGRSRQQGAYERRLRRISESRQTLSSPYLALLAATYVELVEAGDHSVTSRLAKITGKEPETIRIHLKIARREGMLTSIPHRAGGELTEHAQLLLNSPD